MFLEVDEETRDFLTIYGKDYRPKKTKKVQKCLPSSDYNPPLNSLNGPFYEHLNSSKENEALPPKERTEDIRDYLKTVRSKYPHLQKILPAVSPDEEVIESKKKRSFKSIYQLDYSKDLDDYISRRAQRFGGERGSITLPDDWVIPETVYQSYRDPRYLSRIGIFSIDRKIFRPQENLGREKNLMLQITTGNSEYGDVIGGTADRILKEQLHGIPIPLDTPASRFLKPPDTISSTCFAVENETPFISNVF